MIAVRTIPSRTLPGQFTHIATRLTRTPRKGVI